MERLFSEIKKIIGGEFEFNSFSKVPNYSKDKLTKKHKGTWTTNWRSALYLILKHFKEKGVKHVHLPAYLCQSIIQPILELKLDYSFYPIQADLTALPDPPRNAVVLLIHYFGFINNSTSKLRMDSGQNFFLIEDACHVFLNDDYLNESKNQSLFFSTRKHNPTVLGGWCNLELDLDDPSKDIEVDALKSLAARVMKGMYLSDNEYEVNSTIEDYYLEKFEEVEDKFNSAIQPNRLPQFILNLIDNLYWDAISKKRRENWKTLHELIGNKIELLFDCLQDGSVPLGYMIRLENRDRVKEKLATKRIFAPIHWSLPDEIFVKRFPDSKRLADSLLTLPIDQRYGPDEMNYIADTLKKII